MNLQRNNKGKFSAFPSLRARLEAGLKPTPTDCIVWTGAVAKDGYGKFSFQRRHFRAHRAAYELHYDIKLDNQQLNHTCHNPLCCNPEHLYIGTQAQNMQDKVDAGRQARGERHGCAKLIIEQVREIRQRADAGEKKKTIADDHKISRATLYSILSGKTWGWLE